MEHQEEKKEIKKTKKDELETCKKQAEEYLNGWKRAQADFVNYKKDEAKRMEQFAKFANESLVLQLLDVTDNLEAALKFAPQGTDAGWLGGIGQVKKQFEELLKLHGVERIKAENEPFDPNQHEAVEGSGEVVKEEVRAGYTMHGRVIRPARVKL